MPQPVPLPLFDRDPMDVYDWLQHRVHVERWAAVGKDSSAIGVSTPARVYTELPCLVAPASAAEVALFAQNGLDISGKVYFGPDPATGQLPRLLVRDRLVFGSRFLQVQGPMSEAEAEWALCVAVLERSGG